MPGQEQIRRSHRDPSVPEPPAGPAPVAPAKQVSDSAIDSVLDEIDLVLESNAEEFVRGYVQKGGQ